MKKILILGAGRSAIVLINKLLKASESKQWYVDIADLNFENTRKIVGEHMFVKAIRLERENEFPLVCNYHIVVSMLPPKMHFEVAKACVQFGIHLITASYNTPEMQQLHLKAMEKNIIILMECGLDPGIDHMSAMQMIDAIHAEQGVVKSFKSYCGGLMSNAADVANPWKYKITWNPRNVVLAGQGGFVKYMEFNKLKYLNYTRLFQNTNKISIENENFEGYPNRDSLKYISLYGLSSLETFVRGTLRKEGFCKAWHALVVLGFTEDAYMIENISNLSFKDFFYALLPTTFESDWMKDLNKYYPNLIDGEILDKFRYLGLFADEKIPFESASPATVLQYLLESKLSPGENDTDLVVMQHQIEYIDTNGERIKKESNLIVEGNRNPNSAMATTVGLPIFYAIDVILNQKIDETGVVLPLKSWLYEPIMANLHREGIRFSEKLV
ncbi:MAG: saccharopine dehydrogenase C-terminal domain-containing protein [Cytophagales bacterium]